MAKRNGGGVGGREKEIKSKEEEKLYRMCTVGLCVSSRVNRAAADSRGIENGGYKGPGIIYTAVAPTCTSIFLAARDALDATVNFVFVWKQKKHTNINTI